MGFFGRKPIVNRAAISYGPPRRDVPPLERDFYVGLLVDCGVPVTDDNLRAVIDRVRVMVNAGAALAYLPQVNDLIGRDEFIALFHHPKVSSETQADIAAAEERSVSESVRQGIPAVHARRMHRDSLNQARAETGFYICAPGAPDFDRDNFAESRRALGEDYVDEPNRMIDWLWDRDPRFHEPLRDFYRSLNSSLRASDSFLRTSGSQLPAWS